MNCPFCKSGLLLAGIRRYQTSMEHVSDPNGVPSEKIYSKCSCDTSRMYFWGSDGDCYSERGLYNHAYHLLVKERYGELSALNSFAREFEEEWELSRSR